MNDSPENEPSSVSRRSFLKSFGTTAAVAATAQVDALARGVGGPEAKLAGPGAVPVTLQVNGKTWKLNLEPRVTLLDALRDHAGLTGAKEVCDRGTCGACTVLFDGAPIYSCSKLAIDAQGHAITTVEGLAERGKLSKVQQAFVEQDALMCGYCTPGFVVSVTGLLKKTPHPTADQVRRACAGNLCRCGTYPRVLQAALKAAGVNITSKTEVISYAKLA